MSQLMEEAPTEIQKLSEQKQENFAAWTLAELASE